MFKHILLPLDGSILAERAVSYTVAFARAFEARLTLLRVLENPYQNGCSQPVDPLSWRICKMDAKSYLDHLISRFEEAGSPAEAALLDGDPAQHIVKLVSERGIDLVMLSSHGQSGLSSWSHGSVIRKVITRVQTSVMIVPAYTEIGEEARPSICKRIMVPLDGSKRAECVLPPAVTLARSCDSRLLFVHVVARPEMPRLKLPTQDDLDLADQIIERNREEMAKLFEQLRTRLDLSADMQVVTGDHVAERLHELAKQEEADLVILSAHGYSGKTKWPYGSVTTTFIEYGVTPLLIVQDLPPGAVEPSEAEKVARQIKGH